MMQMSRRTKMIGGGGLLAALVLSLTTPAVGQWTRAIQSVLVRNVDEKGRNPYMQFQGVSCPGRDTLVCQVIFPPVPQGKRLVLEQVNASLAFGAGGIRRTALLTPGESIVVLPARPAFDPSLVIVNEPTLAYFESGQSPIFQVVTREGTDGPLVTATLSGYFVNLEP